MKITRVLIKNYRNIRDIDIHLSDTVALIGENNSGKSNFLRAITLPFLSEDMTYFGKNLSWSDINSDVKAEYYKNIIDNQKAISNGDISLDDFLKWLPVVKVEVYVTPDETEEYYTKDLSCDIVSDEIVYGLKYEFRPKHVEDIFRMVKNVISKQEITESNVNMIKMNLLPVEHYAYSISVPGKGSVSYDVLKMYKYTALEAERDEFSRTKNHLGSKSLVKVLNRGLNDEDKLMVEKEYSHFFDSLKNISNMDGIFNWQDDTDLLEAKSFFAHISVLPNMPPMQSILNSIRLGYSEEELNLQGLGYRNLVLLFVLVNSLFEVSNDVALNILTIEEPEAHLCINNIRLMAVFLKVFTEKNKTVQLMYSTHNTEFINKMQLKNVVVMHAGKAFSFKDELKDEDMNYLAKNPNLDLFKLFFSKRCVLFEGISEEMLIRAYIDSQEKLNNIEMISFHKGFIKIIEIWKKLNKNSGNKLGVIRDYDDQENAKSEHDKFNDEKTVCIRTTEHYTLENEIVNTGDNYNLLKVKYGEKFGWADYAREEMEKAWINAKASDMLEICKDIAMGEFVEFQMPKHIQEVLDFLCENHNEEFANDN